MSSDGVLYVEVMPSTRGIGKSIEGDLNASFKGAEKTGKGFFDRLKGFAKVTGVALAGAFSAVAALAIKGGISRALNIEDAQAKLKGLGHDVQSIEAIMTDALASVKGTAFGLDTAATVASTAVAAGIKPGQELEKYLRLTADAATIAGISMEEMGSILNKTTTAGKVYTQELNQLADRGLPVFQWLQEEYGVTAEELRKMVSRGEVDSERFRKVIEENIGGAALASGDTTRGAFANMGAALSRLGLVFVSGPMGQAKNFFNEMITLIDGVAERIKPLLGSVETEENVFEGLAESALAFIDGIPWETVSAIAGVFSPIGVVIKALMPLLPQLSDAFGDLGAVLGDAIAAVLPVIATVIEQISNLLAELMPILAPIIEMMVQMAAAALQLLAPLLDLVDQILPPLTELLGELLIPLLELVAIILESLMPVIEALVKMLGGVIDFIIGVFTGDWERAWEGIQNIFWGFVDGIGALIGAVLTWFIELPGKILNLFVDAGKWLFDVGGQIIQGLWDGILALWDGLVSWFDDAWNGLVQGWNDFWGIESPSKLMIEMGHDIGDGFQIGIEDTVPDVQGSLDLLVAQPHTLLGAADFGYASSTQVANSPFDEPLAITGTMEITGDGLVRIIDGRLQKQNHAAFVGGMR